ncbi:hypothetical protein SFRURICE_015869 [Spodoptera frugiperda]|uniref:SFRICE_010960 n=1 Tax=Spodoptera frugiperda TaxID=7108 RepID=A0A2H1WCX3_SPOFR|nr:hypothetical protein SFRURICE_015869 [Spodoptera frugiperda]
MCTRRRGPACAAAGGGTLTGPADRRHRTRAKVANEETSKTYIFVIVNITLDVSVTIATSGVCEPTSRARPAGRRAPRRAVLLVSCVTRTTAYIIEWRLQIESFVSVCHGAYCNGPAVSETCPSSYSDDYYQDCTSHGSDEDSSSRAVSIGSIYQRMSRLLAYHSSSSSNGVTSRVRYSVTVQWDVRARLLPYLKLNRTRHEPCTIMSE